jgi:hypothetical protein
MRAVVELTRGGARVSLELCAWRTGRMGRMSRMQKQSHEGASKNNSGVETSELTFVWTVKNIAMSCAVDMMAIKSAIIAQPSAHTCKIFAIMSAITICPPYH